MKTRIIFLGLVVMGYALGAAAQDEPATRPAEEPSTQPDSGLTRQQAYRERRRERRSSEVSPADASFQAIFAAVSARNIFLKGDQRPPPASAGLQGVPSDYKYVPKASELVLTGVSLEDNQKVAFLDDQQAYTSTRVKVGDAISDGKVVNITLDALDYKDSAGRTIRVEVGYNLAGGDVWGATGSTPESGASTRPAITGPRAPGESIEDYLRRRRAAELNH